MHLLKIALITHAFPLKVVFGVLIILFFAASQARTQLLPDTSFESEPIRRPIPNNPYGREVLLPDPWENCGGGSTPDLFIYSENTDAKVITPDFEFGDAFVGLVNRGDSYEHISQPLLQPLRAGISYRGFIHISVIDLATGHYYKGPAVLQIWGGDTICDRSQLLWESTCVERYAWRKYYFEFIPEQDLDVFALSCGLCEGRKEGYLAVDWIRLEEGTWFDANLGPDTALCVGDTLVLDPRTKVEDALVIWENVKRPNRTYPSGPTLSVTERGLYEATVYKHDYFKKDTIHVREIPGPVFSLGADTALCLEDQTPLVGPMDQTYTYSWSTGDTTPFIVPGASGLYALEATIWPGCSYTDEVSITLEDCRFSLEMPNVFTPNLDGINDVFQPMQYVGLEMPSWEIVDRWGRSVFQSNSLDQGWDGMIAGRLAPAGVYFWAVRFRDPRGQMQVEKGQCALLR